MNKEIYALGECLTVNDDKGNTSKKFFESKGIRGGYLEPAESFRTNSSKDNQKEQGYLEEVDGKFYTRANIPKNSYLKHKGTVYHVVGIKELRDVKLVYVKKAAL